MSEDVLSKLFATFKVNADIFHNGQYCGNWSIDSSGKHYLNFHLVTHGKCYLKINGNVDEIITLEQGDLVLFPHDAKHCVSNEPHFETAINSVQSESYQLGVKANSTGLVCGNFIHQHPLVKQMTEYLPESIIIKAANSQKSLLFSIIKLLIEESIKSGKGSTFILENLSKCILALLLREHLDLDKGLFAALAHNKLYPAISAIIKQPEHKWSLDSLSSLSHMSRTSFSELFKAVVGLPVMEYVTHWRISVAYRLIKDERISTIAAAIQVGYDNESSFSKAFKRVLGVTPGSVRNKLAE
ncbi:MAG: AraC family transcriptional regulator [Colwellia sp.]|nr:AraC family transcriptional regulator [Colwellia sp.]